MVLKVQNNIYTFSKRWKLFHVDNVQYNIMSYNFKILSTGQCGTINPANVIANYK